MSARISRRIVLVAAGCLSSACAVGPTFRNPPPPDVTHYASGEDPVQTLAAGGTAQRFTPGGTLGAEWWKLFGCVPLDGVVSDALANNPGLDAAEAVLHASQDYLRSGYGIFYPAIDAGAGASRERYSPANLGQRLPGNIFNLFTLSTSINYALDVFGGQRRLVESLHAEVDVARATERGAYLALTANIVNTVIAEAAYRAEVEATQQLIELQHQQVGIAEIQARSGTVPYSSVLSLRSQLASDEAMVPQLEQKQVQAEDLLAALTAHTPAQWRPPQIELSDLILPADIPVSVPSKLVEHRPDILAARASAHAASAAIGVATAALLPTVTLTGSLEAATNSANALFPTAGRAFSIGASAEQPLFEGGALWFKRKAAIDNYHQAMDLYRQAVLGAFQQVADSLRALEHDAATLVAEDAALDAARQALHLIQANYQAGIATYLDVLYADGQLHQAQIADIEARAVRYQDTVALITALGGGWSAPSPPSMAAGARPR